MDRERERSMIACERKRTWENKMRRKQKKTEQISHNTQKCSAQMNKRTNKQTNKQYRALLFEERKTDYYTMPFLCPSLCVFVAVATNEIISNQIKSNEMEIMAWNHTTAKKNGQKYYVLCDCKQIHRQADIHTHVDEVY